MGRKQAFEIPVTGDPISADQARTRKLVDRAVPPEQLDAERKALAPALSQSRAWR